MLVICLNSGFEGKPVPRHFAWAGVYKIRMAIASKGKGKSGGARVLAYNVKLVSSERVVVTLMSVFDKGEMENVSDANLKEIIKGAKESNQSF